MGMTDRDKKVLAGILVVVVLGGFWFLVVGKKRKQIKEANAGLAAAQTQLAASKAAEDQARLAAKVKPAAYSRLLRLGKAIPVDDDFSSLLVQVNNITSDSNVDFTNLSATEAAAATAGATGQTTCDQGASGASGATPAPAPAPSPATSATGSTAQTFVGRSRDKAKAAVAQSQADAAAQQAAACQVAPSLTDITATAAGLESTDYTLTFAGSFYNLKSVFNGLMNMVKVNNGRVSATGRLLAINSINLAVKEFPDLTATVSMTGYIMPSTAATAQAAADGAATTPGAAPAAAAAPVTAGE